VLVTYGALFRHNVTRVRSWDGWRVTKRRRQASWRWPRGVGPGGGAGRSRSRRGRGPVSWSAHGGDPLTLPRVGHRSMTAAARPATAAAAGGTDGSEAIRSASRRHANRGEHRQLTAHLGVALGASDAAVGVGHRPPQLERSIAVAANVLVECHRSYTTPCWTGHAVGQPAKLSGGRRGAGLGGHSGRPYGARDSPSL
jgi:hypothetical protein